MSTLDIHLIKKRSLSGILALTSRSFIMQVVAVAATFILTIFLSPSVFGVFYVVSAIISFLGYFSDIGLAAALIQKKEELTEEDLSTTFTIQQLLVTLTVGIMLFFSQRLASFYGLDQSGLWLLRSLVVAFFLSSLKTIPSIILERKLRFDVLIVPQIVETLAFYGIAVVLAWRGLGVASFTWAVLTRAVTGLAVIYVLSPWRPRLSFSRAVAKKLLRFGLPFQVNSLLALLKDDLLTVFLGKMLPFTQVGYIGWAKKWAEVPLRLIMDNVIRVTFPAYSRLQHSRDLLQKAIERTLFGIGISVFPLSVMLLFYVQPMVLLIPKYQKWEPALLSFYFFVIGSVVSSLSTPLTNAITAVGKIRITLMLMVIWTAMTWILTLLFISAFGFHGVAIALSVITATIVLVVYLLRQIVPFRFLSNISKPFLAAVVQGVWYFYAVRQPYAPIWLFCSGVIGIIIYAGIVWRLDRVRITEVIREILSARSV